MENGNTRMPKGAFSWAMYDWANSGFATTVMAGFFPVFFTDYWSKGLKGTESTFWLGLSVSTAGLIVAILAPMLGSLADRGAAKKRFLAMFAIFGICMTGALFFVGVGEWHAAALFYVFATVGWLSANVFYDSLIVGVSNEDTVDIVSGHGFALGYLGGGLLFAVNVAMTLKPEFFGLLDPKMADLARHIQDQTLAFADIRAGILAIAAPGTQIHQAYLAAQVPTAELLDLVTGQLASAQAMAVRLSFLSVAIWWALFMIPLLLNVPEPAAGKALGLRRAAIEGFAELISTFREIRKYRTTAMFLLAYWLYIDGVDTVITMAVKYGKDMGFGTTDLISALLVVQFVAFPFAYGFGWLGQRFGAKRFILIAIGGYIAVTVLATQLDVQPYVIFGFPVSKFLLLALMIGTIQGGVQALSRSLYSRIIPAGKSAQFFGFYNMMGKFATIIGPLLMGSIGELTGNPKFGILSVSILFLAGGTLLFMVREQETATRNFAKS